MQARMILHHNLTSEPLQVKTGLLHFWGDEGLQVLLAQLVCCHNPQAAHHLIQSTHISQKYALQLNSHL